MSTVRTVVKLVEAGCPEMRVPGSIPTRAISDRHVSELTTGQDIVSGVAVESC